MNPKTERVLGFQGSGFGLAGQLETIEVCKVWPGGARTRIDRHDLVRKHVVPVATALGATKVKPQSLAVRYQY